MANLEKKPTQAKKVGQFLWKLWSLYLFRPLFSNFAILLLQMFKCREQNTDRTDWFGYNK